MANVTIKLNIINDYYSGREDFKESLHTLRESNRNEVGLYQYIEYGNFEKIELEDLCTIDRNKTLKKSLLNCALSIRCDYSRIKIRKMIKDELADFIESHMDGTDSDLDKWLKFAADNNITIGADSFRFYKTRGYNQGDFAEWCIRISDLGELEDMNIKLQPYVDNLFWDAPISYSLTVDGEDYYIDEHINDVYEYNKDEVYGICEELFKDHTEREYILGYIKGNLPKYPKED